MNIFINTNVYFYVKTFTSFMLKMYKEDPDIKSNRRLSIEWVEFKKHGFILTVKKIPLHLK